MSGPITRIEFAAIDETMLLAASGCVADEFDDDYAFAQEGRTSLYTVHTHEIIPQLMKKNLRKRETFIDLERSIRDIITKTCIDLVPALKDTAVPVDAVTIDDKSSIGAINKWAFNLHKTIDGRYFDEVRRDCFTNCLKRALITAAKSKACSLERMRLYLKNLLEISVHSAFVNKGFGVIFPQWPIEESDDGACFHFHFAGCFRFMPVQVHAYTELHCVEHIVDLCRKYESGDRGSAELSAWRALSLLKARMQAENAQFGAITTVLQTWIVRRVAKDDGTESLQVSDAYGKENFLKVLVLTAVIAAAEDRQRAQQVVDLKLADTLLSVSELSVAGNNEVTGARYLTLQRALEGGPNCWAVRTDKGAYQWVKVINVVSGHPVHRERLFQERRMFDVLRDLQGSVIPRLVFAGWMSSEIYGIVTEDAGDDLERSGLKLFSDAVKRDAIAALDVMHSHCVVHGDIACRNIAYDERKKRVKLIDFGLSTLTADAEAFVNDRWMLLRELCML